MGESKVKICRLCFSFLNEQFNFMSSLQTEMLQIILPELNRSISQTALVCLNCIKNVEQAFTFKSSFLEIEDNIHDYAGNSEKEIDLEQVIGINELPEYDTKNRKVCRTCLELIEDNSYMEVCEKNISLTEILQKCLPEMDIQLTKDPVVCRNCITTLENNFSFVTLCSKNDENIKRYMDICNQPDSVDLYDVVRYTWAENAICINKTEGDIDMKDENLTQLYINNEVTAIDSTEYVPNNNLINENYGQNVEKSQGNDVYVISDEEDNHNCNTLPSPKNGTSNRILNTLNLNVAASRVENTDNVVVISDDENNTGTNKKKRKSYVTAVEKIRNNPINVDLSDTESLYSIDSDSAYEDSDNSVELSGEKKMASKSRDEVIFIGEQSESDCRCSSCLHNAYLICNNIVKLYTCTHCSCETTDVAKLDDHLLIYQGCNIEVSQRKKINETKKIFHCEKCLFQTPKRSVICKHMLKYHYQVPEPEFKCGICLKVYEDAKDMKCHKTSDLLKLYKCPLCSFQFDQKGRLSSHIWRHAQGNYLTRYCCSLCFAQYNTEEALTVHFSKHALAEKVISYRCLICLYQSLGYRSVREHIIKAHRDKKSVCNKQNVTNKRNIDDNNIKHVKCPICNIYIRDSVIKRHKKMHKCPCDTCPFNATSEKELEKHKAQHKVVVGNNMHQCKICYAIYSKLSLLYKHMKFHAFPKNL